jgi:hypothetical protein
VTEVDLASLPVPELLRRSRIHGWIVVGERILGAMIAEDWARALCVSVEIHDLFDWRQHIVLRTLRELEREGDAIGPLEIADAIELNDLLNGTHHADSCHVAYVGGLVCERPYVAWQEINTDLNYLRRNAHMRRDGLL